MIDLFAAAAILALLSFAAYAAGLWITLRFAPLTAGLIAIVVAALSAVFALTVRGRLCMVHLFPTSSAVVLSDWLPIGAGFLAGVVAGDARLSPWRKVMVGAPMTLLAWAAILGCFFTGVRLEEHPWSQLGFPVQSSNVTCSPTAAAELLRTAGIGATEREMIDLCLTQSSGTATLALYRGLVLKTAGKGRRVRPVFGTPDDLRKLKSPVLAFVYTSDREERWASPLGWPAPPGDHSIVIYGFTPRGDVDVGDPALGRLVWTRERLADSFSGEAIQLAPIDDPAGAVR